MKKINILNMKECYLDFDHYADNGHLAVIIHPNNLDEEDDLVLSVNIPEVECYENMFWVKSYSYELDYAKELAKENIIEQVYVDNKPIYCTNGIAKFYLYRITPKTFNYVSDRNSSDVKVLYSTSLREYKNRYFTILNMRDANFSLPLAELNFRKYADAVENETNPELVAEINNIIFETNKLKPEDC